MPKKYNPLYLDGPLQGQHYESNSPYVYSIEYSEPTIGDLTLSIKTKDVTYRMRQVAFTSKGDNKAFVVWVAWCGPYNDPPLFTIIEQLCSKDAKERGEFVSYEPEIT